MKLCIVLLKPPRVSETFLVEHVEKLSDDVEVIHHSEFGGVAWEPVPRGFSGVPGRIVRALGLGTESGEPDRLDALYLEALRDSRPDVVLAEYGPAGVFVMNACRAEKIPLVVHFHGSDATRRATLKRHQAAYSQLFEHASAVVAVSRSMERRLVELGAPAEKVHYNPVGVNCDEFAGADPESADPVFVSVGRLVEKKAPHLSIEAFAEVHKEFPDARLRVIGDGPLLELCQQRVQELGLEDAVALLGSQSHDRVRVEMRRARAFVQHSVIASDGNSEGTPVAVMEAGATGLPVVATRHAGIPDVVLHEKTGLLVDEQDTHAMGACMKHIARDASLAARLGRAARVRVRSQFSTEQSLERLRSILRDCI